MFTWSFKWLWAQCLAASAGLFLLAHLALPAATDLTMVRGNVEQVGLISRKGLGSFYELTVKSADGERERVLIDRAVAPEQTIRTLTGHKIKAMVNWSSDAVQFESTGDPGTIAENVRSFANARNRNFSVGGAIALAVGVFLGLASLILNSRRTSD